MPDRQLIEARPSEQCGCPEELWLVRTVEVTIHLEEDGSGHPRHPADGDRRTPDNQALRALLRRAHDAMSRREPDGISDQAWDQLVADIAAEVGVG